MPFQEFEQAISKQTPTLMASPSTKNAEEAHRFAMDIIKKSLKHQNEQNDKALGKKSKSPKGSPISPKKSPAENLSLNTNDEIHIKTLLPRPPIKSPKKFSSGECLMCCSGDEKTSSKTSITDPASKKSDTVKKSPMKRKADSPSGPKQSTVKKKKIESLKCMSPGNSCLDSSVKSSDSKKETKKRRSGGSISLDGSTKKKKKDIQSSGKVSSTTTKSKSASKSTVNIDKEGSSKNKSAKQKNETLKEKTKKKVEKQSIKIAKKVYGKLNS